jgi:hypothetical protein
MLHILSQMTPAALGQFRTPRLATKKHSCGITDTGVLQVKTIRVQRSEGALFSQYLPLSTGGCLVKQYEFLFIFYASYDLNKKRRSRVVRGRWSFREDSFSPTSEKSAAEIRLSLIEPSSQTSSANMASILRITKPLCSKVLQQTFRNTAIPAMRMLHTINERYSTNRPIVEYAHIKATVAESPCEDENEGDSNENDDDDDGIEWEEMIIPGPAGLEWGGPTRGGRQLEPTRYGDWERRGRCTDF